jgi:transcription initiation factor TFIID subunit 10
MAHGGSGSDAVTWSGPSTLSSETTLTISSPATAVKSEVAGSGSQQSQVRVVPEVNGPQSSHDDGGGEDAEESVDPDAINGQMFADFVQSLDEFTPTLPDAVTSYYMSSSGFQVDDPRLVRLIGLSCQKFIADVTNDAMQHCKIRIAQQIKNQKQTKPRLQLTLDDLLPTLKERGINIKKPHYSI